MLALIGFVALVVGCERDSASTPGATPIISRTAVAPVLRSPTPTRTPRLIAPPVSTPIALSAPAGLPGRVGAVPLEFVAATGNRPGGQASATIRTRAGASCWLAYEPPARSQVGHFELDRVVVAPTDGFIHWAWTVAHGTPAGFATLTATCDDSVARELIFILLPP